MVLLAAALAPSAAAAAESAWETAPTCPTPDTTLRDRAVALGKVAGTAYRPSYAASDPCYESTAVATFGSLTPELATFTNALAPEPGRYAFDGVDDVCDLAEANGLTCQSHAIVWDPVDHPEWGIVPTWITALPPADRRTTMLELITAVGRHLRGRVSHTTVANEVFDETGALRPTTWNTTGDDSYLFDAFRAARRADPDTVLLYNDYGAEGTNPKSDAILDLATRLRAETVTVTIDGEEREVPLIDGVGFQAHLGTGPGQAPDPADVADNLARFAAAGLTVRITELDVRMPVVDGVTAPPDVERQRLLYRDLATACLDQPACDGISLWGFTDAHSWITENPATFSGEGAAHPFDPSYRPKPAWDGLVEAFVAAEPASPATPTSASAPAGSEGSTGGDAAAGDPPPGAARAPAARSARWPRAALAGSLVAVVGVGVLVRGRRRRAPS